MRTRPSNSAALSPVILAGPTSAGKSDIALRLAARIGGEIISVDSMQVYRGMDIGTAKPSLADRSRIPHHLIDVVELTEPFDAAQFARLAHRAVADIQSRGRRPILCGGTGFYFRAFSEGLGEAPSSEARLRAELEALPMADLLRELAERDPETYKKIDRQNPRRIVRAVEVLRLTGKPFSDLRADPKPVAAGFGLQRTAADLHARIEARVDGMFARGLVAETEALLKRGLAQNRTAMQALGYRQVVGHLRGERSLQDTVELVKIRTRQFARRQMTWFRRQAELKWIELKPDSNADSVVQSIIDLL